MSGFSFRRQMAPAVAERFRGRLDAAMRSGTPSGRPWGNFQLWRALHDRGLRRLSMIEVSQWRRPAGDGRGPAPTPSQRQIRHLAAIFQVPEAYFFALGEEEATTLIAERIVAYQNRPYVVPFEKEIGETAEGRELLEWAHQNKPQFFWCSRNGELTPESYASLLKFGRDVMTKHVVDARESEEL